jgi:hypothetical protein
MQLEGVLEAEEEPDRWPAAVEGLDAGSWR